MQGEFVFYDQNVQEYFAGVKNELNETDRLIL